MVSPIRFYGLLHIERGESSSVNMKSENFDAGIDVYVNCAITLSHSLSIIGHRFTLLTNSREYVESRLKGRNPPRLDIQEIEFNYTVPSGAAFYSAHFKLDVFEHFASLDEYSVFCDLDVMAVSQLPLEFVTATKTGQSVCYEITDQVVPAYGAQAISNDLTHVHGTSSNGKWYGGEFISGTPEFFRLLSDRCKALFPTYALNIKQMNHVGDEAVVSAAVELMIREGHVFLDAGQLGVIARFWNAPTKHRQPAFKGIASRSLLHLPADKGFLSKISFTALDSGEKLLQAYKNYLFSPKQRIRRGLRKIKLIITSIK